MIPITCTYCAKEYLAYPSYAKRGPKHCSLECKALATGKVATVCAACGETFMAHQCLVIRGRQACSKQCKYRLHRRTQEQTFNRFVVRSPDPDACWGWLGNKRTGYGVMKTSSTERSSAHRFSFQHYIGPIPPGMQVLHRCDNRQCSNPAHLFLGTQADNIADMFAKGRQSHVRAHGEKTGAAKLTDAAVIAIRSSQESNAALGMRYGVSPQVISSVKAWKTWKHVRDVIEPIVQKAVK